MQRAFAHFYGVNTSTMTKSEEHDVGKSWEETQQALCSPYESAQAHHCRKPLGVCATLELLHRPVSYRAPFQVKSRFHGGCDDRDRSLCANT